MRHFTLPLAALLLAGAASVQAAPMAYNFTVTDPGGSPGHAKGGKILSVDTTYDRADSTFSWSHTIRDKKDAGKEHDSFWLVVSDGPNPKGTPREYAILFGDLVSNTLWAYEYNGLNKSNSWDDPGNLLAVWGDLSAPVLSGGDVEYTPGAPLAISRDGRNQTVSFSIDVAGINARPYGSEWSGISFGESIGVWFHPGRNTTLTVDAADSGLASYSSTAGWFDGKDFATTPVPEPTTLSILGIGALAFAGVRRRAARLARG